MRILFPSKTFIQIAGIFYLLPVIFFVTFSTTHAQQQSKVSFERLSSENIRMTRGLSQNSIMCIIQDKKGKLWFGTWDGLNKYDGYQFTTYKPDFDKIWQGPRHQTIRALYEDNSGLIWIGTDQGLSCLNRKTRTFRHFYFKSKGEIPLNDTVWCITENMNGNLLLATSSGVISFNHLQNKYMLYRCNGSDPKRNKINNLFIDRSGIIWVGTASGLYYLTEADKQIKAFFNNGPLSALWINTIYQDKLANIWIGTINGLYKIEYQTNRVVAFQNDEKNSNSISHNNITALYEDWFGYLWVGTNGGGLNLINTKTGKINFLRYSASNQNSLSNDYITCIYEDRAGIVWVGTAWKGVNKINRNSPKFDHYYNSSDDGKSINSNLVWAVYEDSDKILWIGTDEGLNIFDRKNGNVTYLRHIPENINSLSGNLLRTICKDRNGIFWFGTLSSGLDRYDPVKKSFIHFGPLNQNQGISSIRIVNIMEDRHGTLWLATDNGLNRFDTEKGAFTVYKNDPNNTNSLSSNNVASSFEDSKGFIWVCTYNGLNRFDPENQKFTRFYHQPWNSNSLSVNSVFSVYEDKEGIIWICTMGGGLDRYDPRSGRFRHFTEKDGLPNNVVYAAREDNKGNLWLSTNFGLSRFNMKDESFVNFDVEDGVQSHEFNHGAVFKSIDGEFFFGGMNGFNSFYPDKIRKNQNIPPMAITRFEIMNAGDIYEILEGDTIRLKYNQNFFSIDFAALDFANPAKNQYMYMLENYHNDWVKTTSDRRTATFTKVSPGKYIFHAKGSNNDGIWNNEGISFTIIITPPWWGTWFFRITAAALILLTVILLLAARLKRIRKKHEIEKKILRLEKEFTETQQKTLRLQMNPHFIFNSLNSIQNFILKKDEESAHLYLTNFSTLMRKILENSKYDTILLSDEIDTIRLYLELEKLRFSERFKYKIRIEKNVPLSNIRIPPMLIQPYLENAIWHGIMPKESPGTLWLEVSLISGNEILIKIKDDGIGRDKAMEINKKRSQYKSTGMKNIEERIALMNELNKTKMNVEVKDLYDKNNVSIGTEVNLYITFNLENE